MQTPAIFVFFFFFFTSTLQFPAYTAAAGGQVGRWGPRGPPTRALSAAPTACGRQSQVPLMETPSAHPQLVRKDPHVPQPCPLSGAHRPVWGPPDSLPRPEAHPQMLSNNKMARNTKENKHIQKLL